MAPAVAVATALAGFAVATGPPALAASPGWIVRCDFSHSLPDDPIVAPHQHDASHLHDFLGNTSTNGESTYASMTASSAMCSLPSDTAGYWTPALYRNGIKVDPAGSYDGDTTRPKIYYRDSNLDPGTTVEPFPADLRLIAGNSKATTAAENPKLGSSIYWGCSDNSTSKLTEPPASCSTGIISLHVGFPNCWDGVLTHSNDTAHVVYPSGGECPASHPRPLPRVIFRWEYPVSTDTGSITIASGSIYGIHADFWNTWHQPRLEQLVAECLNADQICGTLEESGPTPSTTPTTITTSPVVSPTPAPTQTPTTTTTTTTTTTPTTTTTTTTPTTTTTSSPSPTRKQCGKSQRPGCR